MILSLMVLNHPGAVSEGFDFYTHVEPSWQNNDKGEVTIIGYKLTENSPEELRVPGGYGNCTVTRIGKYAFQDKGEMRTPRVVFLPRSLKYVEPGAFGFSDLEEIRIENGTHYETVDGVLFERDRHMLAAYPRGKKEQSYTVPEGTERIGSKSFYRARFLQQIHLPDSVRVIEEDAFSASIPLTIDLPESIETIRQGAFGDYPDRINISSASSRYCVEDGMLIDDQEKTLLAVTGERDEKTITIPEGIETIGKKTFSSPYCDTIYIPSTLKAIADDNRVYVYSESVEFPEGLETIGKDCDVNYVKEIVFPSSLRSIGDGSFRFGDALESVFLREGIESIGYMCFDDQEHLETAYLPWTLGSVNGFRDCPYLMIFGWPNTAAEEYCQEYGIPFQPVFDGQWQVDSQEAETALNLPGAEDVQIWLSSDAMELTYTQDGSKQLESYSIEWKDGHLYMEGGYMIYTVPNLKQLILEMNGAQLHLTRMEETE